MAGERLRKILGRIGTTEEIIKTASRLPGVDPDEAGEALALTRELHTSIVQMRDLFDFTPAQIEEALQMLSQLQITSPHAASLETIRRALEFQQALEKLADADEALMKKLIEGDPGLEYVEPKSMKAQRLLLNAGYRSYSVGVPPAFVEIFKPVYQKRVKKSILGRRKEITQETEKRIGSLFFREWTSAVIPQEFDWLFKVNERGTAVEAIAIAKDLRKQLDVSIYLELQHD